MGTLHCVDRRTGTISRDVIHNEMEKKIDTLVPLTSRATAIETVQETMDQIVLVVIRNSEPFEISTDLYRGMQGRMSGIWVYGQIECMLFFLRSTFTSN